jgi:hypothetical protein
MPTTKAFIDLVIDTTRAALQADERLPDLVAARQRDETALQKKVFRELSQRLVLADLDSEHRYPEPFSDSRCAFWCRQNDDESWVQLKVFVTSYCPDFAYGGGQSPNRSVDEILFEIKKLRTLPKAVAHRHVVLLAYPMPLVSRSDRDWYIQLAPIGAQAAALVEAFAVEIKRADKKTRVVGYRIDV